MTPDLVVPAPKRRAIDSYLRVELFHVLKLEARTSVTLPAIVAGLAGAATIVYVATRYGSHNHRELPAEPVEAIGPGGVTLVK